MLPAPSIVVSGYTQEGYGAGPGMARFQLSNSGLVGERSAENTTLQNPSFMADGGDVILVTAELPQGRLIAVDRKSLAVVGHGPSGGADTCHVTLVSDAVWAANYSSGTAAVVPLASLLDGATAELPELLSHPGSGPVKERQGESHAHQVVASAWGTVLVPDLGADRVDEYSADSLVRLRSAELPPGTGPRHMALKGDFLLVAGELDGHVHVLQRTARDPEGEHYWHWLFKAPLAKDASMIETAPEFFPSHIELSADGNKLYAAVRGVNTLVVLDVSHLPADALTDMAPTPPVVLQEVPTGGNWPRHFALSTSVSTSGNSSRNDKIYIANQLSNSVDVFELDAAGLLGAEPVQSVEFGSPACILLTS